MYPWSKEGDCGMRGVEELALVDEGIHGVDGSSAVAGKVDMGNGEVLEQGWKGFCISIPVSADMNGGIKNEGKQNLPSQCPTRSSNGTTSLPPIPGRSVHTILILSAFASSCASRIHHLPPIRPPQNKTVGQVDPCSG